MSETFRETMLRMIKSGNMPEASRIARTILAEDASNGRVVTMSMQTRRSQIGDRLAEIIERETGEEMQCVDCQNEVGRLNGMTAAEVLSEIDALSDRIVLRGKKLARAWWQKWAISLAPDLVKRRVMAWICEAAEAKD